MTVIINDLTEAQQKFFVELIFNSQNLKTDLQNIFSTILEFITVKKFGSMILKKFKSKLE